MLPGEISGDEISEDVLGRLNESTADSMLMVEESRHAFESYHSSMVCYMHTRTRIRSYIHTHLHKRTYIYMHPHTHTQYAHMHTYIVQTCIHTDTCSHAQILVVRKVCLSIFLSHKYVHLDMYLKV